MRKLFQKISGGPTQTPVVPTAPGGGDHTGGASPSSRKKDDQRGPLPLKAISRNSSICSANGTSRRQSINETQQMLRRVIPGSGSQSARGSIDQSAPGKNRVAPCPSPSPNASIVVNDASSKLLMSKLAEAGALPEEDDKKGMNKRALSQGNIKPDIADINQRISQSRSSGNIKNAANQGSTGATGSSPSANKNAPKKDLGPSKTTKDSATTAAAKDVATGDVAGAAKTLLEEGGSMMKGETSKDNVSNYDNDEDVAPPTFSISITNTNNNSSTLMTTQRRESFTSADTGDVFNINIVGAPQDDSSSDSSPALSSSSEEDAELWLKQEELRKRLSTTSKRESMRYEEDEAKTLEKNLEKKVEKQNQLIATLQASSRRESFRADDAEAEVERLQHEEKIRLMQIAKLEEELKRQRLGSNPYSDTTSSSSGSEAASPITIMRIDTDGHEKDSEVIIASKGDAAHKKNRDPKTKEQKSKDAKTKSAKPPVPEVAARLKQLEREIALVRKQGVEKDHEIIRYKAEIEVSKNKAKAQQQTRVQIEKLRNELTEEQKRGKERETKLKQQLTAAQGQLAKFKKTQELFAYLKRELLPETDGQTAVAGVSSMPLPGGGAAGGKDGNKEGGKEGVGISNRDSLCSTNSEDAIQRDVRVCDYLRQELVGEFASIGISMALRRAVSNTPSNAPSAMGSRIVSRQGSFSKKGNRRIRGSVPVNSAMASATASRIVSRANSNDSIPAAEKAAEKEAAAYRLSSSSAADRHSSSPSPDRHSSSFGARRDSAADRDSSRKNTMELMAKLACDRAAAVACLNATTAARSV